MTTLEIQVAGGPWQAVPIVADHGCTIGGPERITSLAASLTGTIALEQAGPQINDLRRELHQFFHQTSSAQYRGGKAARRMMRSGGRRS